MPVASQYGVTSHNVIYSIQCLLAFSVCCLLFTPSLNVSCSGPSSVYSYSSYFINPRINNRPIVTQNAGSSFANLEIFEVS